MFCYNFLCLLCQYAALLTVNIVNNLLLFALVWYNVCSPLQVDTVFIIRSRKLRHIRLKTSHSSPAQDRHSQLHWTSSTPMVLLASRSTASWTDKETLLTPAKIHRYTVTFVKQMMMCQDYYQCLEKSR